MHTKFKVKEIEMQIDFFSAENISRCLCALFYLHLKVNEKFLSKRKFNSNQHWLYLFLFLYICSKITRTMKALLLQCTFLTTLCLAAQCIAASPADNSKYLPVSKLLRNVCFCFFLFLFFSSYFECSKNPSMKWWLSSFRRIIEN